MPTTVGSGATPVICRAFLAPYRVAPDRANPLILRLAETRLAIYANDPGLLAALADAYWDFPGDDGPVDVSLDVVETGDNPIWPDADTPGAGQTAKESWLDLPDGRIVCKRHTGIRLVFGPAGNAVLGPCRSHLDQVVNAINCRFMEREIAAGAVLLHAAAVSDGFRGLAIAGQAGAGKSTLALELTRRGACFVSNDRLLVASGPQGPVMTGQPRAPRVNPGTLLSNDRLVGLLPEAERCRFAAMPEEALRAVERKYDVSIHRAFGPGRFLLRAALTAVVVLGWKPGGGALRAEWTCLSERPELAAILHKELGPLVAMGPRAACASDMLAVLGHQPLLYLSGGLDRERAAALSFDLLTGSGRPALRSVS